MSRQRLVAEIESRCASLRAAARLLPDLMDHDADELTGLMVDEAARLSRTLIDYQRDREVDPHA